MASNTNYSGTTYITYGPGSGSSSNTNSRGGTPDRFGDRLLSATDQRRVPVEESASGFIDQKIRVNSQGRTVVVENHKCRTK